MRTTDACLDAMADAIIRREKRLQAMREWAEVKRFKRKSKQKRTKEKSHETQ